ncbi:MAG: hypothetical protein LBJ44_02765 [Propionibacteriaceae bacterium]|jgi:D-alanine-D-alanine ligase-like ATP-grasp enzyme|nr:hypothetical protein [Propionibacteriaceae bacterium]
MSAFGIETAVRLWRAGRLPALAGLEVEPAHGHVAVLVYRDGARRVIRDGDLGCNPSAGAALARDKDFTKFALGRAGLAGLPGFSFALPNWRRHTGQGQASLAEIRQQVEDRIAALGWAFPLYVKPNDGSQGLDVQRCRSRADLVAAVERLERHQVQLGLVEPAWDWPVHRLVVLDGAVVCAYQTVPLTVTGDGRSDLRRLIERARSQLERQGRTVRIDLDDPRIPATLADQGLDLDAVLAPGRPVRVRDSSNLSAGGTAVDWTGRADPSWLDLAARAAAALGLRWCGVDLLCPDLSQPGPGRILELNAAPGLEHYANLGPAQRQLVEGAYEQILGCSPGPLVQGQRFE